MMFGLRSRFGAMRVGCQARVQGSGDMGTIIARLRTKLHALTLLQVQ